MRIYPKNIEEAAKLLDEVIPNWYTKINTSELDFKSYKHCILGQLYGEYGYGFIELFGEHASGRQIDTIFGTKAPHAIWMEEINIRKKNSMNFPEALIAMNEGKSVTIVDKDGYIFRKSGDALYSESNQRVYSVSQLFDLFKYRYKIIEPKPTFGSLKVGDKFRIAEDGTVYTKCESNGKVNCINSAYQFHFRNNSDKVEKVDE